MKQFLGKFLQKDNNIPEKANQPEPILALSISAGVVKASIWELNDHTIQIIGLGVKTFSDNGREKEVDYKSLSDKTAESIDLACQVAEVDIKKTFFGLPQSWFKGEDIYPEYNELLEKLAATLDLEAIAYVSIPHSISYYLQYLHKTPTTALLIGSSREGAQICYVEQGKIKEEHYITWAGGSLGKNIDKGLMQFKTITDFPASIFIYGYGDLEAARDDIAKYSWTIADRLGTGIQAPKFLSTPKVTVLEEHVDSLSVALVGGKDFARHHNIQGRLDIKSLEYSQMNTQAVAVAENILPTEVEAKPLAASDKSTSTSDVPFGFVVGADVLAKTTTTAAAASAVPPIAEKFDTFEMDDKNLEDEEELVEELEEEPKGRDLESRSEIISAKSQIEEDSFMQDTPEEKDTVFVSPKPKYNKPRFVVPQRNIKRIGIVLAILLLVVLGGGGVAAWAYWNIPQSTVTVYVKPENLEKQLTLSASEKITVPTSDSIPSQRITIELKESKDASTSGKRTTGEVAKGEVTVINKTGTVKKFNSGTEITTSNLKFKLSEDVTVASASSETTTNGETKTYGKSVVKVTANDIGPEGNVDKDASFALPSFTKDDFEAVAVAKFSGGSKKDIKVVSSTDRTNLSRDLKSDMQLKIPQLVREKVGADQILLEQAWQTSSVVEKFNKNVNDESSSLTLEVSMKVDAFAFKKSDIEQLFASVSTTAIPEGYELKDTNKDIRTSLITLEKDGTLKFSATSSVSIIPKINEDEIAQSIIGKKQDAAQETIMSNKKVADVSFEYSVRLPDALVTLPHIQKNIKVVRGVR
jgi:hypothetical protein